MREKINSALLDIHALLTKMEIMGAQDYERDEVNKIIELLTNGKISAENALKRVKSIFDSKLDYH